MWFVCGWSSDARPFRRELAIAGPFDQWTSARFGNAAHLEDIFVRLDRRTATSAEEAERRLSAIESARPGPLAHRLHGRASLDRSPTSRGSVLRKKERGPLAWLRPGSVRLFSYPSRGETRRGSMTFAPQRAYTHEDERAGRVMRTQWHSAASPLQRDSSRPSNSTKARCLRERRRFQILQRLLIEGPGDSELASCVCARWGTTTS